MDNKDFNTISEDTAQDILDASKTMKQVEISQEDYDFLKDLQYELNTQTNDGNADPVYWGVMESEMKCVPEGCGDPIIYMGDGGTMTTKEAVEYVENDYLSDLDDADKEEWAEVDKTDMDDVVRFMNENLKWHDVRVVYERLEEFISRETGAFLTKRACKTYIERCGYNHCRPRTYAMTAYRNYELERLLSILKTMELKEE